MHKKQKLILISLIIFLAIFLRFYRIQERAAFLGDQGRDLLEVREALLANRIPLTGPPTSQNFNTGPFHYYLIAPSLVLAKYNPLGPTVFSTSLGVFTTILIFFLSRELFGLIPALISSLLYATSPLAIQRTLGIWNPIDIPMFTILVFLTLYQIQEKKKFFWLTILGILMGITIQFHPSTFLVFLFVLGWWFYFVFKKIAKSKHKAALKWSAIGGLLFFSAFIPFSLYQIQNNFIDLKKLFLFLGAQTVSEEKNFLAALLNSFTQQFRAILSIEVNLLNFISGLAIISLPFFLKNNASFFWHKFLTICFLGSLFVLSVFINLVQPHYTSFLWILPFLLLASFLQVVQKNLPHSKKILIILTAVLVAANLKGYVSKLSITNDLTRAEVVSAYIVQKAEKEPFSILLLSDRSPSDTHFRYSLELKEANVKRVKDQNIPLLFLICTRNVCPTTEDAQNLKVVETECLPYCPPLEEEKMVDLTDWQYVSTETVFNSSIYLFQKPDL